MKLTNQQIVDAVPALKILGDKEIPFGTSLAISRTLRKLSDAYADYAKELSKLGRKYSEYEAARVALVQRHAKKDSTGKQIPGAQEGTVLLEDATAFHLEFRASLGVDADAFSAEQSELLATAVELDVTLIQREALAGISVKANTLAELEWLIVES